MLHNLWNLSLQSDGLDNDYTQISYSVIKRRFPSLDTRETDTRGVSIECIALLINKCYWNTHCFAEFKKIWSLCNYLMSFLRFCAINHWIRSTTFTYQKLLWSKPRVTKKTDRLVTVQIESSYLHSLQYILLVRVRIFKTALILITTLDVSTYQSSNSKHPSCT